MVGFIIGDYRSVYGVWDGRMKGVEQGIIGREKCDYCVCRPGIEWVWLCILGVLFCHVEVGKGCF